MAALQNYQLIREPRQHAVGAVTGANTCPGGCDPVRRPVAPALFCTDITDANTNKGDWQIVGGMGTRRTSCPGRGRAHCRRWLDRQRWCATCTPETTVGADPLANVTHPADPVVWNAGPYADTPAGGSTTRYTGASVKLEAYGAESSLERDEPDRDVHRWRHGAPSALGPGLHNGRVYRVRVPDPRWRPEQDWWRRGTGLRDHGAAVGTCTSVGGLGRLRAPRSVWWWVILCLRTRVPVTAERSSERQVRNSLSKGGLRTVE